MRLDAIERGEVLKGSASSLYGADAIGGVVNIVTRGGAGDSGMRVRGGAWGTAGASAQVASVVGSVNTQSNLKVEKADGWRPGSDYRIGTASVSIAGGGDSVLVHLGTGVRSFGANAFYGAYNSDGANWRDLGRRIPDETARGVAHYAGGVDPIPHGPFHARTR